MASEAKKTVGEPHHADQPEEAEHGHEADAAAQTDSDGDQQQGNGALQRSIAQALEPALSELVGRMTQGTDQRSDEGEAQEPAVSEEGGASRRRRTKTSSPDDKAPGGGNMANQTPEQDPAEQESNQTEQPEQQANRRTQSNQQAAGSSSSSNPPARPAQATPKRRGKTDARAYNPTQVARVGRLQMAREWRDQGSVYEALKAYEEIIAAYPGTGVAAAAVEDLVQMAQNLQAQGQFHAALDLYHRLEQLGVDR